MPLHPYIPIDELLEQPIVRILRALRHFDWIDVTDLMVAIGFDDRNERVGVQSRERNNISVSLRRGVRDGLIEKRDGIRRHLRTRTSSGRNAYELRITASGRAWLSSRLAPDARVAGPREVAARPGTEHLLCA